MDFDWEKTKDAMLAAAAKAGGQGVQQVQEALKDALIEERQALQGLYEQRLAGEFTDKELHIQLEREKSALNAKLAMVEGLAKLAIQKATDAAVDAFWCAVDAAIHGSTPGKKA